MGKLDELMKASRSVAAESMGAPRPVTMHGASPAPSAQLPDRLKGVIRSKNVAEIPVSKIGADPNQPREEFDGESLGRLADSLKAKGQLQPIRVRWDEGSGLYVIICGERRWRAAQKAGLETMSAVIVEGPLDAGELLAIQMIENCVREDLKPVEQARAFRALIDRNGWSARQVARELGIDQSNVVRALALLNLPDDVQGQVEQGALSPATAYEVSKLEDPNTQVEVAARVVAKGLSRAETVEVVRQVVEKEKASKLRAGASKWQGRGAKAKPAKLPTTRTIRTSDGYKFTVERKRGIEGEGLVKALEEALEEARSKLEPADDQDAA